MRGEIPLADQLIVRRILKLMKFQNKFEFLIYSKFLVDLLRGLFISLRGRSEISFNLFATEKDCFI